jgi:hypothetical protein
LEHCRNESSNIHEQNITVICDNKWHNTTFVSPKPKPTKCKYIEMIRAKELISVSVL